MHRARDSIGAVRVQTIASPSPVPTVGKRSLEFSGYMGDSVYRPLVAILGRYSPVHTSVTAVA